MFNKTLIDNNVLFRLYCKEICHIESYHAGNLIRTVENFSEIYGKLNEIGKNEMIFSLKTRCDNLIYEYEMLLREMKKVSSKVLETLIDSCKEKIKEFSLLREKIEKI